mgnify:CR=1 FL=1
MRCTLAFTFLVFLSACNTEPQPINYGKDICENCTMTIMDKKFGAEMVNKRGKAVKFDSGECMLGYCKADNNFIADKTLMVNYANPGELIDAKTAFYLHGGTINSPMGGQLAAFKTREEAEKFQKELGGNMYSWNQVIQLRF